VDRVNEDHLLTAGFIQPKNYTEVLADLEGATEFSTIVVDTLGKLIDYMVDEIMKNPKNTTSIGTLQINAYQILNNMFKNFCNKVRFMNKNLIFVAHEKESPSGDRIVPDVRAGNYNSLATELDLIGYIPYVGMERTLSFTPTSERDGKNTGGFEPLIKIPQLKAGMPNDFFAKNIIAKHFENVENKEKKKLQVIEKFKEIDLMIADIVDSDTANLVAKEISSVEHIGTSLQYAKTKFSEKVKSLGLVYDKETKLYSDAMKEVS
jgi:hypothetical protein